MILLDTTVLVYAKAEAHRLRDPCRDLIEAIAQGNLEATTTVEVIQEVVVHVRARRRGHSDAAQLGRDYAALLSPLLSPDGQNLEEGLSLFERVDGLGAFDAVLAASAATADIRVVVSADSGFSGLAQISHVVPDRAGLAILLAG